MSNKSDKFKNPFEPGRQFTCLEAQKIADQILNDDHRINPEDEFHNIFFHEIRPVICIANHLQHDAIRVELTKASAPYDAAILIGDQPIIHKIEFTTAIDGYNDALQMELLEERGHAPAFQKIEATGKKGDRDFGRNRTEAIEARQYDNEILFPLLEKALELKKEKSKTNVHYRDAWLGIVFDDWIMPIQDKKRARFDPICRRLLGRSRERYVPFSRVFCVGISGEYLFDSSQIPNEPFKNDR